MQTVQGLSSQSRKYRPGDGWVVMRLFQKEPGGEQCMPWGSQAGRVVVEGQCQQLEGVNQTGLGGKNERMRSGLSRDILSREPEVACRDP